MLARVGLPVKENQPSPTVRSAIAAVPVAEAIDPVADLQGRGRLVGAVQESVAGLHDVGLVQATVGRGACLCWPEPKTRQATGSVLDRRRQHPELSGHSAGRPGRLPAS
jgi:hypothetical protein